MGQAISKFGVIRPSFEKPLLNEDAYRIIQSSLDCTHNFQERMERVMATPVPHKEPILALLLNLSDPWPFGYSSLEETLDTINDIPKATDLKYRVKEPT